MILIMLYLCYKFDLKVLGKIKKLLGIEFSDINEQHFIHQKQYIGKICKVFSKYNFPQASLPIAKGAALSKLDSPSNAIEVEEMSKFPYRKLLGCLSFIANRTRLYISYAVNILSQFQESPGIKHWNILLKLLGYLSDTRDLKLNLSHVERLKLNYFSDSDFAANRDNRVSIGGLILMIHNVSVSWRTFKHKCVSLSTMEAEYISLTEAAKEIIWIQTVINECSTDLMADKVMFLRSNQGGRIDGNESVVDSFRSDLVNFKSSCTIILGAFSLLRLPEKTSSREVNSLPEVYLRCSPPLR
ncbi:retrovirus-related Pol polyprotein from transposon TNT 1-94 [Trichonephila clavipes]|uniref:Retrovirus-related Pol polyprotein from transposon TNT 1-94 n=1 Tax=Trichonephila clavipes TaxID=2585209 RepID=A0A8X7BFZ3_TRICX|nr:retrovirus-related Pol polyprotein from transposon TNT 1-94 [Trichonephila clavipes]